MKCNEESGGRSAAVFYLFSFASGFLALIYEILWMRRLAVLFGATTPAAAATLSAFFLGVAAGSAVVGKRTMRWSRPLRLYGLLEAGIAAGALLVEPTLWFYGRHYPALYSQLSGHPALFLAGKILLSMAAVFVPTFLMGGALPALAQAYVADRGRLGVRGGGLYAANTFGATVGALSVPFALLPLLGADRGYLVAIAGSLCLGGAAWLADAGQTDRSPRIPTEIDRETADIQHGRLAWSLGALAFLSGFLQLALEVLWTRMFALVHENSVYSFSLVLAVFLTGLAGGAVLAREFLRRGRAPESGLVVSWIGSGLLVLLSPHLFYLLSSGMNYLVVSRSVASHGLHMFLVSVPIMLPATLLSGCILPLLMELAGGRRGTAAGPVLGSLLAINTVGSIAGPLVANFVLASRLGLWWSIALVGGALALTAELVFQNLLMCTRWLSARLGAYVLLGLAVWILNPGGLPRVPTVSGTEVRSLREGTYGAVAVMESGPDRWMMLNNYYVLGGTYSARNERLQAHLPLFLHPRPDSIAFLGLGTGTTAGASLLHPVKSVVMLEIIPEVIDAAREHFAEANRHVLDDPRVQVLTEDARNFLRGSGRKFDVIVGDLVVPWRPGESSLFSLEHFRATREALLPGGIFCQWLPLHQVAEEGFRIVASTFLDIYPEGMLWRGDMLADQPVVALIGQKDPAPLDIAAIDRRIRELADQVRATNPCLVDPAGFWLCLVGKLNPQDARFSNARRNRDSRPWLELWTSAAHLSMSEDDDPKLHGRFLVDLFEAMRGQSLQGSPLHGLDAEHLRWRNAGALLWEASILSAEGKETEAQVRRGEALAALPPQVRTAVTGGEFPARPRDLQGLPVP